jgi:TRAP-type C4-dicarboxylate transport system permease small subunit
MIKVLSFIDRAFAAVVKWLLVAILLIMVLLGALQVFLRNLFNSGISWSDVASRNMVLWIAFLGAILATRKRQHIAIDAISRFIPSAPRNIVAIFLDIFSCAVCYFLAKASYLFVLSEKGLGSLAFGSIQMWVVESIIPIGFAMISLEYAIGVCLDIYRLTHPASGLERRGDK